ncbi:hypothetical protein VP01_15640g1, partial [Puccinia sorghi]
TLKAIQHFTDATWADEIETRLSRSGSICFWKSFPVAWNIQENIWIKFLIEELYNENLNPSQFNVNNEGLIHKINNLGSTTKTKHLDIKAKCLCDLKKNNEIL